MVKFNSEKEARILEACAFARSQKKPNLKAIGRKFDVSYHALRNRHIYGSQALNGPKPGNRLLKPYQEEAIIAAITDIRDINLPITHAIVTELTNDTLRREGYDYYMGKNWMYNFEKKLPNHLNFTLRT